MVEQHAEAHPAHYRQNGTNHIRQHLLANTVQVTLQYKLNNMSALVSLQQW